MGVAGSGVLGLFLSRWIPPRLRARGEEVLYERIPAHRRALQRKVEELVAGSVKVTDSTEHRGFLRRAVEALSSPGHGISGAICCTPTSPGGGPSWPRRQDQLRYMNDQEREIMADVIVLVQAKDDLDYQAALQGALKFWLFVHIPLTYSLLIFSVFHILVVYTFSGVIR